MCVPACWLFVHATGTTGRDARARRRHEHAARCAQCGVELAETTRVAAHVVAYPLGNPCVGCLTLRSTCKACNHARSRRRPAFWGAARVGGPRSRRRLRVLRVVMGRTRRRPRRRRS